MKARASIFLLIILLNFGFFLEIMSSVDDTEGPLAIPDDPFSVLDKPKRYYSINNTQYSDISDEDFEIPVSQKRLSR